MVGVPSSRSCFGCLERRKRVSAYQILRISKLESYVPSATDAVRAVVSVNQDAKYVLDTALDFASFLILAPNCLIQLLTILSGRTRAQKPTVVFARQRAMMRLHCNCFRAILLAPLKESSYFADSKIFTSRDDEAVGGPCQQTSLTFLLGNGSSRYFNPPRSSRC